MGVHAALTPGAPFPGDERAMNEFPVPPTPPGWAQLPSALTPHSQELFFPVLASVNMFL